MLSEFRPLFWCSEHPISLWRGSSHINKQFSDISWVPHHSTQFWRYLLRDSIRCYRFSGQSHKIAHPTTFRSQVNHKPRLHMCFWWPAVNWRLQQTLLGLQIPADSSGCYLYFWPACFKLEVPKTPTSRSTNLLERPPDSEKHFTDQITNLLQTQS